MVIFTIYFQDNCRSYSPSSHTHAYFANMHTKNTFFMRLYFSKLGPSQLGQPNSMNTT